MAMAPEFSCHKIEEVTQSVNSWVFGIFMFQLIFGTLPNIISDDQDQSLSNQEVEV